MSHASPDKPYVRQLVAELRKADITVWFDEDSIAWGESLRPAINKGSLQKTDHIVRLASVSTSGFSESGHFRRIGDEPTAKLTADVLANAGF